MFSGASQSWQDALGGYLGSGGLVMPALLVVTALLWYALGSRWAVLQRGTDSNVRVLIRRYEEGRRKGGTGMVDAAIQRGLALRAAGVPDLRRRLDEAFGDFDSALKRHATLIASLVGIAPMLGLLGTVMGMIVTFESLGDMTLFSQSGGIASGIATALFTTQMGLVVAVPGLIAKTVLDRRAQKLVSDLAQIKDILVSAPDAQG
ncbi:MAG: MotA/TolQ/ExbB proton channel family protein [Xanthomonadaceae bacterium]|nr:MotA/TolQ/ExbB proton channel family protein [Xanthomonadaceae bacterium]